jgi:outer membrane protein
MSRLQNSFKTITNHTCKTVYFSNQYNILIKGFLGQLTLLSFIFLFSGEPISGQQPMTLKMAVDSALQGNFGLMIAKNELEIAENLYRLRNSGFLPRLEISGGNERALVDTKLDLFSGESIVQDNALNTSLTGLARLDWTIFDGFAMFAQKDMAEANNQLGSALLKQKVEETVYLTAMAFYNVVQQQKLLEVLKKSIEISAVRRDLAKKGVSIGATSATQLRQAQNDINADTSALLVEELRIKALWTDLYKIFGKPIKMVGEVEPSVQPVKNINFLEIKQNLQLENPQVLILRQQLKLKEAEVRESRGTLMPSLNIYSEYRASRITNEAGFLESAQNLGPALGLALRWDLFNGFTQKRLYENRKIEASIEQKRLAEAKNIAENDFSLALEHYTTYKSLTKLEKSNLRLAEENLEIAFRRFNLGNLSDLELREFQKALIDAELRVLTAEINTKLAELDMLYLSGRISEAIKN